MSASISQALPAHDGRQRLSLMGKGGGGTNPWTLVAISHNRSYQMSACRCTELMSSELFSIITQKLNFKQNFAKGKIILEIAQEYIDI
jgi:hypothetical protein